MFDKNSIYSVFQQKDTSLKIVINAYYCRDWVAYDMRGEHKHSENEIMYLLSGSANISVKGQLITMQGGDLILIDTEIPHCIVMTNRQKCRMLNIEFLPIHDENFNFAPVYQSLTTLADFLHTQRDYFLLRSADIIYPALRELISEVSRYNNEKIYNLAMWYLLAKIARLSQSEYDSKNCSSAYVEKVIEYLHLHYDTRIKIEEIALSLSLNSSYLQRIFKKATGETIIQYLLNLRMEKAKMLVENTDASIDKINEYVGVLSKPYFYKCFKAHFNETPLSLRKKVINKWRTDV